MLQRMSRVQTFQGCRGKRLLVEELVGTRNQHKSPQGECKEHGVCEGSCELQAWEGRLGLDCDCRLSV